MFPILTASFLAGLVFGSYLPYVPVSVLSVLIVTAVGLTWVERSARESLRGLLLYAVLLAGVLYWNLYAWAVHRSPVPDLTGSAPARVLGTVVEPVRYGPDRAVVIVDGTIHDPDSELTLDTGRIRLTWREPDRAFARGDRIEFAARLHPPAGLLNPGGFDYAAYLERQDIQAIASVTGPGAVRLVESSRESLRWGLWQRVDRWRDEIRRAAVATLEGSALGIYLGMIVGEQGYLPPEARDTFMSAGVVHILSISGSHLGLIAVLSFGAVKRLCLSLPATWLLALSRRVTPTRLAAAVTVAPITFYTALAGAEVATVRSLVMILLFLAAVWLGRDKQLLSALALAALLILLHDPRALFDISFQLSYLSVLAIALALPSALDSRPDATRPDFLPIQWLEWGKESVRITGTVSLVTLPLVAYYFNQIAWVGLIANLIVVPLAGLALVPLGLGSAVWLLLAGGERLPAATLNQMLFDLCAQIAEWFASVPGAEWHVAAPAVPALGVFYALLWWAMRRQSSVAYRIAAAVAVLLLLGWWSWSPRDRPDGDAVRVTFLDVGQGDAAVVELPEGRTVLIDGGGTSERFDMGRNVVGPFLWNRGVRTIDRVIGTHPQVDHVGGLAWILRHFPVSQYWGNGVARSEAFYRRLEGALAARGLAERVAQEGDTVIDSESCRLFVLNPPAGAASIASSAARSSGTALNNRSVVTRLECGSLSFLFAADLEAQGLLRLVETGGARQTTILKVPHHGAKSSLSLLWLEHVRPDTAVISVGRHNPYGHPAASVLEALAAVGSRTFRTDVDGAVWITAHASSSRVTIHTMKEWLLAPVRIGAAMMGAEWRNLSRLGFRWGIR